MSSIRRPTAALIALAAMAALAVPAISPAGLQSAEQFSAKLKGNQEVPGPGDRNGRGEAFVSVKTKKRKLCFQVSWEKIERPVAGHIHKAPKGEAGPIKVLLFDSEPPTDIVEGCVKQVKKKLLKRIAKNPEKFYVNVHNSKFPDGAIRGQLKPAL
jgi:hypothetical protein